MGKRTFCLAIGCLLTLLASPSGAPAAVADQQQLLVDAFAPAFQVGGATDQLLAQTVTAGVGGGLAAVRLPVSCTSGSLTLQIRSVAGGAPSGVVLAAQTFSGASLPPAAPAVEFRTLALFTPLAFAAGERFALVLRSSGTCAVAAGPLGDSYPRGSASFQDTDSPVGAWSPLGGRADLPFQTLVDTGVDGGGPATEEDGVTGFLIVRCFVESLRW